MVCLYKTWIQRYKHFFDKTTFFSKKKLYRYYVAFIIFFV
jgi:hypothetical protein